MSKAIIIVAIAENYCKEKICSFPRFHASNENSDMHNMTYNEHMFSKLISHTEIG